MDLLTSLVKSEVSIRNDSYSRLTYPLIITLQTANMEFMQIYLTIPDDITTIIDGIPIGYNYSRSGTVLIANIQHDHYNLPGHYACYRRGRSALQRGAGVE